jgi:hypothetical protein
MDLVRVGNDLPAMLHGLAEAARLAPRRTDLSEI